MTDHREREARPTRDRRGGTAGLNPGAVEGSIPSGSTVETVLALRVEADGSHRLGTARVVWDGERPTFAVDNVSVDGAALQLPVGSTLYVVVSLRRR